MKTFLIQSPCYRANGHYGSYYSIAFTDNEGNVIKGYGDHISELSYGVKNVYEAEGTSFSDSDRFITIKEVEVDEAEFDAFLEKRREYNRLSKEVSRKRDERFGTNTYKYVYGQKKGQEEREQELRDWELAHRVPYVDYYGFLKCVKNGNLG
ncbi:hypothetical protein [Capnocytophaga canis]|uniref:Uncharacterized protein n=1 Tax=Capnocytophaga canis TaxID=1848903 RepID=A0A0B7ITG5_9FLAO|nr:hypothetical protein [Capnocytophaga canis]CEN53382.1 conserved hypothetical protein [Capnocytophaga canis]